MSSKVKDWVLGNIPKVILIVIISVLTLKLGSYIGSVFAERDRLHAELIGQTQKYEQLNEHAAKLEIQYADQKKLQERLERDFAAERDALKGRIKVLSNATFLIREEARRNQNSDLMYEGQKIKYVFNEIRYKDGPPLGYVLIFDDGRVTSKIYNHEINVKTAISRDESSGRYNIVSKADYILKSPHLSQTGKNWMNEPYHLKITGGSALIDPAEPLHEQKSFHLWAPTLNGGVNVGSDVKVAGGLSLMGYGYSERDLDWKFLQLGMDYSKQNEFGIHLIPAMYRPFPKYLKNTYVGAGVGLDNRVYNMFLSLSVGL